MKSAQKSTILDLFHGGQYSQVQQSCRNLTPVSKKLKIKIHYISYFKISHTLAYEETEELMLWANAEQKIIFKKLAGLRARVINVSWNTSLGYVIYCYNFQMALKNKK